jgi:hypothetical protein
MRPLSQIGRAGRFGFCAILLLVAGALAVAAPPPGAGKKKLLNSLAKKAKAQPVKPAAPPPPRSALLTPQAWQAAPLTPLADGEIDQLVAREQQGSNVEPAPRTTDEQFIRRVTLDVTGQLPLPADLEEFVADRDPGKRARLIDKLLATDEYATHWARYWRDVFSARVTDRRGLLLARPFEDWLREQFRTNQGWDRIARAMLTAEGECRFDDGGKNGAAFFLASRFGPDAANEQAAEMSRIFLGIQIQCAQCHDHPYDQWKRVQFHELAGYFARVRERPIRGQNRPAGVELISLPRGEHEMPGKEEPAKGLITPPRFLDGTGPAAEAGDRERRRSLADAVTAKKNCWFAVAYVNRVWGELMGQAFYQPVDDLGPNKEAVFPSVLTRLTGAFRGSNYDVKALFHAVLTTETYQRQIRLGESAEQHLHFAAAYPTRLRADALWDALVSVLGSLAPPQAGPAPARPFAPRPGLEGLFKLEFRFDPSARPDEVEGSIPQALLLMNNPLLNQRLQAQGTNLLARILESYPRDDEAVRMVYLRALARKPTDRELQKCRDYLARVGRRTEAFEDILWALLNSAEFQTKR